jgi:DNA-directed RNA polymerase, mitochondrial
MNLARQIEWERECAERGSAKYYAQQDRLREKGRGDMTEVSSYLIKDRLREASELLEEYVTVRVGGKSANYNKIIRSVAGDEGDYTKIAYIGLKAILRELQVSSMKSKRPPLVTQVASQIAKRVEAELKCRMFEASNPEYYDAVRKSMSQQNVTDFVHQHKTLMKKFNEFGIEWNDWNTVTKIQVGTRVLRALLDTFGDILFIDKRYEKGKTPLILNTTVEFDEWAGEFERERGLLTPDFLPLKIPPRPWTSLTDGGYHTPALRLDFIKTVGKGAKSFVSKYLPQAHLRAVNKMQRTAWKINDRVLSVQEEVYRLGLGIGVPNSEKIEPPPFPEHLKDIDKEDLTEDQQAEVTAWKVMAKECYWKETKRKGQVLGFMQAHRLAKELRQWEKMYFAYNCDFRGRIYCATAGLSPQGSDGAKGLLQFSKGVKLGRKGVHWLAVHGANTFGEDKLSYEGRVKWIQNQEQFIRQVVEDPISHRDFWGSADKPYQFLAFCYEWADCDYGRNPNVESHIPVGLDGSCNGLQHFSAMLRDYTGAKATNLTALDYVQDIYQEVADVTTAKLKEMDDPRASKWLQVGVDRKCAKRPVMTLPYGATQQSAREYIYGYVVDNWAKFGLETSMQWEFSKFLTPVLWSAISEVVVAAREGMDWLQKNVGKDYAHWITPIGFPVYQYYKDVKYTEVRTQLEGSVRLIVHDLDKDGAPKRSAQRNGVAPNFVHSLDSTHMVMTINVVDVDDLAMIHDDFGTHAGNTEHLFKRIRDTFKTLYSNHKPLHEWAEQRGIDTDTIPAGGTYNIEEITNAAYFFG